MTRCKHDFLPGQCGTPKCPHEPPPRVDIALNRRHVKRVFGYEHEQVPQVGATIVAQPTTDVLPERGYGGQLPVIGYGHWAVQRHESDAYLEWQDDKAAKEWHALRERFLDQLLSAGLNVKGPR